MMVDDKTTEAYDAQNRKLWYGIVRKLRKAADAGKGIRLTPDEVLMLHLSYDDPETSDSEER